MATEKVPEGFLYAREAGADLTGKLFQLIKVDTDGRLILAAASTDSVLGVLKEEGIADAPVTVQYGGISKVKAGAAIVAGTRLTSDGSGKAISTTTASHRIFGIALEAAGAADVIIPVALIPAHIAVS